MKTGTKIVIGCVGMFWLFVFILAGAGLFVAPPSSTDSTSVVSPPPQTATLVPRGIRQDHLTLIRYMEKRYNYEWFERTYRDNSVQYIGQSPTDEQGLDLVTTMDSRSDLVSVSYSFSFPYDNGEEQRLEGARQLLDVSKQVLGHWSGYESWVLEQLEKQPGEYQTIVDDLMITMITGDEESQRFIVILIIEELYE